MSAPLERVAAMGQSCLGLWAKCWAHGSTAPPYYRRPAGSVRSKASWWWCPSSAPALVEAQCTVAERAQDIGRATLASASGNSVAAEPSGVGRGGGRSGRATGAG